MIYHLKIIFLKMKINLKTGKLVIILKKIQIKNVKSKKGKEKI